MTYRFYEHTSDLIIEGENKDFPSALADVASGMFTQIGGDEASDESSIKVEVSSGSKEGLVVALLTKIIAQCEIENFTPKSIEITSYDSRKFSITAIVRGEGKPAESIIKAVTYHELEVEEKEGSCRIKVLFDI